MTRKEGKEGKVARRGRVEVVVQDPEPRSRGKICTNPVCRHIFLFLFCFSLHVLQVSSICWSIGFYDSRLNFSKVTSTWGILVFYDNSLSERKTSFTHFQKPLQWESGFVNAKRRDTQKKRNLLVKKTEIKKSVVLCACIYHSVSGDVLMKACYWRKGFLSPCSEASADAGSLIVVGGRDVFSCRGPRCHISLMNCLCKLIEVF